MKPFNLRLPVLYALSLALGILYSSMLSYFAADGVYLLIPAAIFLSACVIYLAVKKNIKRTAGFFIAVLFFVIGSVYLFLIYKNYCAAEITDGVFVKISGKVVDEGITSGGSRYIVVGNASAYDTKLKGKVIVYLTDKSGDYCKKGYTVSFYAYITKEKFFSGDKINSRVIDGIRYYCTASALSAKSGFSLFGSINYAIENRLYGSLSRETAGVCFALLTGNTSGISREVIGSFRYGGIAHIFAVSGLHIGVIYGIVNFITKRTGVNRFVATALKVLIITLYAGVCNFTPSSVRAVVMCSVSSLSFCLYRKNDRLNSLSVAAIILLLINPAHLFDTGFLLSFSAVLGIILLSHNLSRALKFIPKKLRSMLVSGWSAQIATIPALIYKFGYVSAAGLFLNIILIPLISVVYVILLLFTLIALIIPVSSAALPVAALPIEFLINTVGTLGFEKALIKADFGIWIFVPFICAVIAASDKFNIKPLFRIVPAFSFVAVFSLLVGIYMRTNRNLVTFGTGFTGGSIVLHGDGGTVLAITENYNGYIDYGDGIDKLVILGGDNSISALFSINYTFDEVYLRGANISFDDVGETQIICKNEFTLYGIDFRFDKNVLYICVNGVSVALVTEEEDNPYGVMPSDVQFNLYCYGDKPAVLYEGFGASFDLTYTGSMSYTFISGRYLLNGTIPKEP